MESKVARALAVSACLASLSAGAMAGTGESRALKELSLEELLEVEIRAPTKAELPMREAPAVGTVISREEMAAYGWVTLADVLLRQPGFTPSQDFERLTIAGRGQHEAWSNNHIRLLIDGVPVNGFSSGTAFVWEMLPLSMVESVEIMRNQGSALYGSNAINGVVAINTRKAGAMPPAEIRIRSGSEGTQWQDVAGAGSLPWVSVVAGYGHRGTRGNAYDSYDASGRTGPDGSRAKFEVNDTRSTHAAFLKLAGDGPLSGFSLQAHWSRWTSETGHGWLFRIPDESERDATEEAMAWLAYASPPLARERLRLEFVAQWKHHGVDWRIKEVPDGGSLGGDPYPDGVTEAVQSVFQDYFLRAQADYRAFAGIRGLLGIENTFEPSHTEGLHRSNVDLNRGGTLRPFPDGGLQDLKPLFEAIEDQPFNNFGTYLQVESGDALGRFLAATAGLRYDVLAFDYVDLDDPNRPSRHRTLEQLSPRAALVVLPGRDISFKALAERSFRTPAPGELFTRNSLLGNADPEGLDAEEMTAFTLACDAILFRYANLRLDGFVQEFENQIGFSGLNNLTSNLYTRKLAGVEAELLARSPLLEGRSLEGFLNATWVTQLEEEVLLPGLVASDNLTWAPEQSGNAGLAFRGRRWDASVQGHFQGRSYRRDSDRFQADGTPTANSAYRPPTTAPWATLDALLGYRFGNGLRLWAQGRNLLDEHGYLTKPGNSPFDYRIEGLRLVAAAEIAL